MADAREVIAARLRAQYGAIGTTVEHFGGDADALLEDISAAGLKVVGREPIKEMIEPGLAACQDAMDSTQDSYSSWEYPVANTIRETWIAMFDAAPPSSTQGEKK